MVRTLERMERQIVTLMAANKDLEKKVREYEGSLLPNEIEELRNEGLL